MLIYTGPIDEFFDYRYGKLPYRSLRFEHETLSKEWHQPVAVVNYPNEFDYTRVTEFKHLTGQNNPRTSIVYEFPQSSGDPVLSCAAAGECGYLREVPHPGRAAAKRPLRR